MLVRKAAKLFVHVKDIIAKSSLASSIGQEYSALLRAHLLPVSQYCTVVSSIPFQGSYIVPCLWHYSQHSLISFPSASWVLLCVYMSMVHGG